MRIDLELACRTILALAPLILLVSVQSAAAPKASNTADPLEAIVDKVIANPDLKPITRKAIKPANPNGPLQFYGQRSLTQPLLEAYLDRAISHMNLWNERSRQFLQNTGTKFVHWADLGWVRLYTEKDWKELTDAVDAVHSTDWGSDVIFECGIMEAIGRDRIDATPIPKWMLTILDELGLQEQRQPGPRGKEFFSYEAMFDRKAENWPKHFVGMWHADPVHEQSVPDITMLETRLYYAYLIAEYIDAGFEGVMFGQVGLTGRRDSGNEALRSLCRFSRRWALARGYRKAVTLTSHVLDCRDYPVSPHEKAQPLFTHLTFPSRLSYSNEPPHTLQCGPHLKRDGNRQGGEQIARLLDLPHDLPILLEIDNYGPTKGPSDVCDEGYDEITGYANKPPKERSEFLRKYYFECRNWKNRDGNARVHFAPSGYRCLNAALSLYTTKDGKPSKPTSYYLPFKEDGGEEETIKELFKQGRMPEEF